MDELSAAWLGARPGKSHAISVVQRKRLANEPEGPWSTEPTLSCVSEPVRDRASKTGCYAAPVATSFVSFQAHF